MARWDAGAQAVRTSIQISTPRGRALVSRCMETADLGIRNAAGQTWEIVDYYAHVVDLEIEDTGEVVTKIRLVMVCTDGKTISTVSEPCIKAFAFLASCYGQGPWNPPILIRVKENKGKRGHTYCTLSEVERVEQASVVGGKRNGK
jgi:Phage Single-stranded DNA-binding protein